jgi:putative modified peptide
MTSKLERRLATKLLQKLATDDSFRAKYQADPRSALLKLGVSANEVPAKMDPVATLADKLVFAHALAQVQAGHAVISTCMHPPTISLNIA